MSLSFPKRLLILALLAVSIAPFVRAQSSGGRLTGKVVDDKGNPIAGVTVIVTDQVSGDVSTKKTNSDGSYRFNLRAGSYRITVGPPYEARFGQGKTEEYGVFSNLFCDRKKEKCPILENVIIKGGDRKIDFGVAMAQKGAADDDEDKKDTPAATGSDRREVRDRWRFEFPEYDRYGDKGARGRDIPFRRNQWYNPYDRSVLKGDFPIIGNKYFMILSAVSATNGEIRRTPAPTNNSAANPDSGNFFGRPESLSLSQFVQVSFEFFKGDTVFRPRTWAFKISPTFSVPNYLNARENGIVNIDPRRGTNRTDSHVSLEEAFGEVKLFDTNENYDFVSVRAGIQPFNADFRGFLYTDNNLGARLFGAFANNKVQFNLAYFKQLEKDTNSGLNTFDTRNQDVYVANLFRQDFLTKGYTIQAIAAYNDDRGRIHYDTNGFLVRPSALGSATEHKVRAGYVGFNGDGHIGLLNLSNSYYFAFGNDNLNPIAGRRTSIRAHMAAVEASLDRDYIRYRASVFFASGDKNPTDGRATGFDAILDDPNFVGGQFSYWNRQGIGLISTNVGLTHPLSLLPSLRSSKIEGQANFVNPGIQIFNLGMDVEITQTVKAVLNANYLRFDRTESLEYVLLQPRVRHEIGGDFSLGVIYRPLLINNITFTFGGNMLLPGKGFKDIFTDTARNCPIPAFCAGDAINPSKLQYSLFAQTKLIF
ncbi:MAG: carboxypeptidase-like regulatory domain-containing protein [Pyrinomonadaceae bacterium]